MLSIYVGLFFSGLVAGFLELIVFNEEILLALCFITFVFFAYNYLQGTVFDIFSSHAGKIESDILIAFNAKHNSIVSSVSALSLSKTFVQGLALLDCFISRYDSFVFQQTKIDYKHSLTASTVSRLNEILSMERILKNSAQRSNLQSAIYPVIFSLLKSRFNFENQIISI